MNITYADRPTNTAAAALLPGDVLYTAAGPRRVVTSVHRGRQQVLIHWTNELRTDVGALTAAPTRRFAVIGRVS